MPTPVTKIDLAPTLKALTKSLEQTTGLVTSLKNGVGAEEFSQLQDKAKETASVLREVAEELGGKPVPVPTSAAKADEGAGGGTRTLTAATAALEKLTSVVNVLKNKTEMTPEEFAMVVKDITEISNELAAVGERYPSPTAKAEESAAASDPAPDAAAVAAAAATAAAAAAAEAAKAESDAAAAAAAAETPAELPAADVVKHAGDIATALEAAAKGEISKAAFDAVLKGLSDTMLRGGVMLDTGDLGVLKRVIEAIHGCLSGQTDEAGVAKSESAARDILKALANDIRELTKVDSQAKVGKALKTASLVHSVLQGVNEVFVSKVEAGRVRALAKRDDQTVITAAVEKAVAAAVKPFQTTIAKLTEDNEKMRTEIGKRDAEPTRRASSTDPIVDPPVVDHSKIFPMNYNAPSLGD